MKKYLVVSAAAFGLVGAASASDVLWDNGGTVTHPGEGSGGADVSMAGMDITAAGSNARELAPGPHFRIADDFTVSGTWTIDTIIVLAYETGSAFPAWFGANLNVWDGPPDDPASNVVATGDLATFFWEWTGVYRVFNGSANLLNTQRPIMEVEFDMNGLELSSGTYWVDWQVEGGLSGWAPYVMEANPAEPNNPTTVLGNGMQMAAGPIWQPVNIAPGVETPFFVIGKGDVPACPWDLTGSGTVGVGDLLALLGCWGPVQPGCEAADFTGSGIVGVGDLLELLGNWGPCP